MNTEQERAEFEAWAASIGFCVTGKYAETIDVLCAESAFKAGYQAGREALQSQEYTSAIGEAGQAYLDRFKNAHALPAEFRWSELWAVMCFAANKGRTDATQSQDREDALIETVLDACDEWSGYVEVDNAPRTLREHVKMAIDHARRVEGGGE